MKLLRLSHIRLLSAPIGAAIWLLAAIVLAQQVGQTEAAVSPTVYLPPSMRSEGRIILTYGQGEQITQHHMTFSETIDADTKRSKISLGYVSHKPIEYTTWPEAPTITTDPKSGTCTKAIPDRDKAFLPELDWFVRMIYTDQEVEEFLAKAPYLNGPSGLIYMMLRQKGEKKSVANRIETHRNIPCKVYKMTYDRSKTKEVEFEIYVPEKAVFDDPKIPFFTAREVSKKVPFGDLQYDVTFTIDYFNIESLEDEHKRRLLERDLNMPLGRSCSRMLPRIEPKFSQAEKSFIMSYYQQSALALTSLAYDHRRNYLRKEIFERTVDIWDLNSDILYHIDPSSAGKLTNSDASYAVDASPCSVLNVWNAKLGSFFRPFQQVQESLDVTRFLGAESIAYVGVGKVRELPCAIYETVLAEPPVLFASSSESRLKEPGIYDYIIQFYLLRTDPAQVYVSSEFAPSANYLSAANFWPVRLTLYRVNLKTDVRQLLDQLDVVDFHWGLLGANKKPSELFMARECYDDEDEQTRVEMALDFKFRGDLDRKLLAHNKFSLEYDLSDELIDLFKVARTNIVEYELEFRPHDLVVEMVLADRQEDKSLIYQGEGELPEKYSYANNRLVLLGLTEEQCISTVSLIDEISFVVYCPFKLAPDVESTCTAIYSESEPAIKQATAANGGSSSNNGEPPCQIYRFVPAIPLKRVTTELEKRKQVYWQHPFHITVDSPITNSRVAFAGSVVGLEISRQVQLKSISHYSFVVAPTTVGEQNAVQERRPLVRQFKSITYNNVGDCEKICNLDSSCRSYSYCGKAPATASGGSKEDDRTASPCILSSFDIRESKVDEQLVRKEVVSESLTVNDANGVEYQLRLSSSCNIYERDYLNMFKLTEEVIRLDRSLVWQFKSEPSLFECAKRSIEAEEKFEDHHATMFAYCSYLNTCLFNEDLFKKTKTAKQQQQDNATVDDSLDINKKPADEDDVEEGSRAELQCSVYRRKYQNYFKLSPRVFVRQPMKQVELAFSTVEECARACWNQFGQVCGSFDYCSPNSCLINDATQLDHSDQDEFEVRNDCLHYERDLALDKLRVDHLIGRHTVLDEQQQLRSSSTFGKFILNILLLCFVSGSFLVGLVVGRQVNDRLEHLTIVRQSFSAGSSGLRRMSQAMFGFTRFYGGGAPGDEQRRSFASDGDQTGGADGTGNDNDDDDYFGSCGSTAIQMEEIKRTSTIREEEEDEYNDAKNEIDLSAENHYETVADDGPSTSNQNQSPESTSEKGVENLLQL